MDLVDGVQGVQPPTGDVLVFVRQAHSFAQQARLAITLAWIAGYTNIATIIICGTVTSHVSGTTSNLGRDLAEMKWTLAIEATGLLLAFFAGAMLSGFTTELGRRRGWESIYVLPMAIEALLLAAFSIVLEFAGRRVQAGSISFGTLVGLASMAMGLQNATITRISSGVVRTTHVTGVLTDLGLEAAQMLLWMRDRVRNVPPAPAEGIVRSVRAHPSARRLALLASIMASFALGAGLGTVLVDAVPRWAMYPPVLFLLWIVLMDVTRPIAEIAASGFERETGVALPRGLAVYHLRRDSRRQGRVHRLPNLLVWEGRLSPDTRVVVMDMTAMTGMDENAALEFRAVLTKLRAAGRRLVFAGLTRTQYEEIRRAGAGDLLDPMSVCPDIELAIARGLAMLESRENVGSGTSGA
jgi:uncharacterized membrane protein YoaK (UPF0700 family)